MSQNGDLFLTSLRPKRARSGSKMRFRYYQKLMLGTFLIFCMKLYLQEDLNLTQNDFLGKTLFWRLMRFSSFIENQYLELYFIFRTKLQQQSLKIDLNDYFGKSLFLRFMDTKGPKSLQNEVFQVFEKSILRIFLIFCIKL